MKVTLTRYEELETIVEGFRKGEFPLLVISGSHGVGKSRMMADLFDPEATAEKKPAAGKVGGLQMSGYQSPAAFYVNCEKHADQHILIDDVDGILNSKDTVLLLKQLCQTEERRRVEWQTMHADVKNGDKPKFFWTSSPVCVVCNSTGTDNPNKQALLDRGYVVEFVPTLATIHAQAAKWFHEKYPKSKVYDYIGNRLADIPELSFRHYELSAKSERSKLPWTEYLESDWGRNRLTTLRKCIRDNYELESQIEAYGKITSRKKSTFYTDRKHLLSVQPHCLEPESLPVRIRGNNPDSHSFGWVMFHEPDDMLPEELAAVRKQYPDKGDDWIRENVMECPRVSKGGAF